jgi:hypothetical protein
MQEVMGADVAEPHFLLFHASAILLFYIIRGIMGGGASRTDTTTGREVKYTSLG